MGIDNKEDSMKNRNLEKKPSAQITHFNNVPNISNYETNLWEIKEQNSDESINIEGVDKKLNALFDHPNFQSESNQI